MNGDKKMAKSKYLLLILPLFLASCGPNSTGNTLPSTDSGSNSTSSNSDSSSSIVDDELTQETVNDKIGDISKLKTWFHLLLNQAIIQARQQKPIISQITNINVKQRNLQKVLLFMKA